MPVLKCSQAPQVHFVWCWIPCRSLLPPACPQLLISWMMCRPPERNKWGFPWLPRSLPHPMGITSFWCCLLCIPQTLFCSPHHHHFIPPLPALALGHYCGLQSLPLGCIFSSFSEWLVWNRELITLIPLTAATCPLRWNPNTLAWFNWNPQRLIPVCWPSSSPATFAARGTLHILTGCLAGWFRTHHLKHPLTDKSLSSCLVPALSPLLPCSACLPLSCPSRMLPYSTMYNLPWLISNCHCLPCLYPGVGVPPLQLQHASLRLTREGTSEHLSHAWSNRRKVLPTPLTALPSALWPLAAHPASVLVGVSCVQIAGVCWLCPTEVGWIEPVS